MSYPGNPALPKETQDRAMQTFQQTIQLVTQGRDQEATQGCQFILQLDPLCRPAQRLLERIQSAERPIRTDDLLGPPAAPVAAAPVAAAPVMSGLGAVLQDLLSKGNYQQVVQIAETQRDAIAADPQLQQMVTTAQAKLEREPFVTQYLDAARSAFAAGQADQARQYIAKAREIDPQNQAIETLSSQIEATLAAASVPSAPQPAGTPISLEDTSDFLALQEQSLALDEEHDEDPFSSDDLGALEDDDDDDDDLLDLDDLGGLDGDLPTLDGEDLVAPPPPGSDTRPIAATAPEPLTMDVEPLSADASDAFDLSGDLDGAPPSLDDLPPLDLDAPLEEMPSLDLEAPLDDVPSFEEPIGLAPEPGVVEPAAAPAAAPAATGGGGEGGDRISQLLEEGGRLFDIDEFQAAIDVWSRIFLIDIDNGEASRRIEEARNKKAEIERQAEEKFHEGIDQVEAESLDAAQESFRRVLELQPNHSLAKEYLEQLEAGEVPTVIKRSSEPETPDMDLDASMGGGDFSMDEGGEPGSPSMDAAVQRDRMVVVKKTDKKLVALGALVLITVLGGVGFLATQWSELFPNTEQQAPPPVERPDPIARAEGMYDEGNLELAIQNLEKIPLGDARYEDAIALLEKWRAELESKSAPVGPSPELVARRDMLLGAARDAYSNGFYIRSRRYFDRADKIVPLDPPDRDKRRDAEERLSPLQEAITAFEEGKYVEIIPDLWRTLDENPLNHDAKLLLVNSYFNLSLTDLRRGDANAAAEKLADALEVAPEDQDLHRLKLFAESYSRQEQDLLFRIYVKYAPTR